MSSTKEAAVIIKHHLSLIGSRLQVLSLSLGPVRSVFHQVLLPAGSVLPQLQAGGAHRLLPHMPEQRAGGRAHS